MSETRRVLLVDDDREILRGAHIRLRSAGFDVLTAHEGHEGVSSAIAYHPDAIVMDVRMPGMDGLAALTELRRRDDTRTIPVVMLSASLMNERRALDLGCRYFVEKPYEAKKLIAAVDAAIRETEAEEVEP